METQTLLDQVESIDVAWRTAPTTTNRARWNSLSRSQSQERKKRTVHNAPADWIDWVNEAQTAGELDALRKSVNRGTPYGSQDWMMRIANRLQSEFTLHRRGRLEREER